MIRSILISVGAVFGMAACDRPAAVVNVPASPVVVPGPTGATGSTGATGATGATGDTGTAGRPGESATIIVTPPLTASAPTN